ncbi:MULTISPECIES: PilZ domain-containing protein [unclassified Colwellia]|uniref:PilZ domain-containing protein n=1 Tax=unclassified Colwellia TaxID=196834 RepID=UPI0015F76BF7|nr:MULTISPECIES: PilZ domain-containing protein [unclassified Colwellia]MBA6223129.1 flagellar brake protein [Colwellia sp. MB3u-45]MBA6267553.1 flagellar brake protein [Colwellia sp. MB3u-43]MBA6289856.1 flagellar brake protein [Colwellia sp. MB3u-4]MBA6295601.1 flagellar brake protein [Colwellia sp. MB02u-9]MBA6320320.1 flagellar brake protein [Colwellia sp. MB02u-19]
MPDNPIKVPVIGRLSRNLALLNPGAIVTLDMTTPSGQRGKFRSVFIGYMPKKYVLVQYPDSSKLGSFAQYVTQGIGVTVRGLIEGHEGAVVAFISNIRQTIQIPSRIIVLDFPREVLLQNLRSSMRIETYIKAKVKVKGDYWASVISDISVSGCQIMITNGEKLILTEDKPVEIIIEAFQDLKNLKLNAEICNTKTQVDGVMLGVKFDDSSKVEVNKLLQQAVILPH